MWSPRQLAVADRESTLQFREVFYLPVHITLVRCGTPSLRRLASPVGVVNEVGLKHREIVASYSSEEAFEPLEKRILVYDVD